MIRKHLWFTAFMLLVLTSYLQAEEADNAVTIHNGFITGNDFRALSATSKSLYAIGLFDGILLAPLYGASEKRLDEFSRCAVGMTDAQVVAILKEYLDKNPGRWHNGMHLIAFSAMRDVCQK